MDCSTRSVHFLLIKLRSAGQEREREKMLLYAWWRLGGVKLAGCRQVAITAQRGEVWGRGKGSSIESCCCSQSRAKATVRSGWCMVCGQCVCEVSPALSDAFRRAASIHPAVHTTAPAAAARGDTLYEISARNPQMLRSA